jgi:protein KTI12
MPLITFCGPPCSGKTTRAQELRDFILHASEGRFKVVLINLETLSLDRVSSYTTPANEKETHSSMKSLVDKSLSKDTIVICDYLNYIKGVRYELFCLARALGTSHCVVCTQHALHTIPLTSARTNTQNLARFLLSSFLEYRCLWM